MLPGFVYFVSIHTRPTVVRGPAGEVYRDVTEATEVTVLVYKNVGGKGLIQGVPERSVYEYESG